MTQWYALHLGDALIAQPRFAELERHLSGLYERAGRPSHLAACYRHENQGMHCHLVVFVTAGFRELAGLEAAVPSSQPDFSDLSFLAGNRHCLPQSRRRRP